jgi:hypothetical protein
MTIHLYYLVEHFIIPITLLILLRKARSEHNVVIIGSKVYDRLLHNVVDEDKEVPEKEKHFLFSWKRKSGDAESQ